MPCCEIRGKSRGAVFYDKISFGCFLFYYYIMFKIGEGGENVGLKSQNINARTHTERPPSLEGKDNKWKL